MMVKHRCLTTYVRCFRHLWSWLRCFSNNDVTEFTKLISTIVPTLMTGLRNIFVYLHRFYLTDVNKKVANYIYIYLCVRAIVAATSVQINHHSWMLSDKQYHPFYFFLYNCYLLRLMRPFTSLQSFIYIEKKFYKYETIYDRAEVKIKNKK